MKTIWKFPLRMNGAEPILVRTMPFGAGPVRFEMQGEFPTLWCTVDTKRPMEDRRFLILGTGHEIPEETFYIASCSDGPFVWHLFEVLSDEHG